MWKILKRMNRIGFIDTTTGGRPLCNRLHILKTMFKVQKFFGLTKVATQCFSVSSGGSVYLFFFFTYISWKKTMLKGKGVCYSLPAQVTNVLLTLMYNLMQRAHYDDDDFFCILFVFVSLMRYQR